ncbi:hypothetical protein J4234_05545 [Candidatus Woesearchaeota archaeon]|nr:hypothetical protein [Candidatus Woesearchaeota archaeon]
MEQQLDVFTQKRFELIIEMATKKLQQEINALKETACSQAGEINSLKSQISRLQFQPPQQTRPVQRTLVEAPQQENQNQGSQPKKEVKIVDCRPEGEKRTEFKSGAEKNAEPVRPRYGDYEPKDVSIDKFFYFGRK